MSLQTEMNRNSCGLIIQWQWVCLGLRCAMEGMVTKTALLDDPQPQTMTPLSLMEVSYSGAGNSSLEFVGDGPPIKTCSFSGQDAPMTRPFAAAFLWRSSGSRGLLSWLFHSQPLLEFHVTTQEITLREIIVECGISK